MSSKQNRIKAAVVSLSGAALVSLMVFGTGMSSADFSATDNFKVTSETATLSLELGSPSDGYTGELQLQFDNLAPGEHVDQVFWVKNTGSIPASVSLTDRTTSNTAGPILTGADWEYFRTGVVGYSQQVKSNVGLNADLGILQPGEERAYTLRKSLESEAGNNWQGVRVGSNVVVTLKQL